MPLQLPARNVRACRSANVIGPALIRFRHERGWTQDELVARLQVRGTYATRDIIANIESGRSSATDTLVLALATTLGVATGDLFPAPRPGMTPPAIGLNPDSARFRRRPAPAPGELIRRTSHS